MSSYYRSIANYYYQTEWQALDGQAVEKMKLSILDLIGCALAAAPQFASSLVLKLVDNMGGNDQTATIWGSRSKSSVPLAAFANGIMAAALELDDATSIGASVHPGAAVIPAAIAAAQHYGSDGRHTLRAALFGYDVCNRMGLLATEKIRELGLHGPGMLAGLGAVSAAGMLAGLTLDELEHAFGITASLSPFCPFINYTDGSDTKDLYGGWGVYLALLAVDMARLGMTASPRVFTGPKTLQSIFAAEHGIDVAPASHSYSRDTVFKDYAACLSVHATMTAIAQLQAEQHFAPQDIAKVQIETYPYACDISQQVELLNPISARLHLPYTAAVMLYHGALEPDAFQAASLADPRYRRLMSLTEVSVVKDSDSGPFGKRGSAVTLHLTDGRILAQAVPSAKWSADAPATERDIIAKFKRITASVLSKQQQQKLVAQLLSLEEETTLQPVIELLSGNGW